MSSLNLLDELDFRSLNSLPILIGGQQVTQLLCMALLITIQCLFIFLFKGTPRKLNGNSQVLSVK